jgi:hypothetical protein
MHVCPLLLSFRLTLSGAQTLQSVRVTYLQIYHQWVHLPLSTSHLAGRFVIERALLNTVFSFAVLLLLPVGEARCALSTPV